MNGPTPDDVRNPYAPPNANVEMPSVAISESPAPIASGPLYSVNQIALAAFLGFPISAAWLGAANFKALAQPSTARKTLLWGWVATLMIVVISYLLPDRVPNMLLPLVSAASIRALAEFRFQTVVTRHKSLGGSVWSWWRVVGITLLFTFAVVVVLFAVLYGLYLLGVLPD